MNCAQEATIFQLAVDVLMERELQLDSKRSLLGVEDMPGILEKADINVVNIHAVKDVVIVYFFRKEVRSSSMKS